MPVAHFFGGPLDGSQRAFPSLGIEFTHERLVGKTNMAPPASLEPPEVETLRYYRAAVSGSDGLYIFAP